MCFDIYDFASEFFETESTIAIHSVGFAKKNEGAIVAVNNCLGSLKIPSILMTEITSVWFQIYTNFNADDWGYDFNSLYFLLSSHFSTENVLMNHENCPLVDYVNENKEFEEKIKASIVVYGK